MKASNHGILPHHQGLPPCGVAAARTMTSSFALGRSRRRLVAECAAGERIIARHRNRTDPALIAVSLG